MPAHIDRTGETNIANNGMKMTIIAYRTNMDMDVQFDDGAIVKHRAYCIFKKGEIAHPGDKLRYKQTRIGETNIATNGQKMTIIAYRKNKDLDVQFEDGTIVTNKSYDGFQKGKIKNPNCKTVQVKSRIGEENIATNGMKMTIIAYHAYTNIDVQFSDGVIVTHKTYKSFKKGEIAHPADKLRYKQTRIGETNTATNGQKMTIIAYRKNKDLDVQFEDGTIVTNKSYDGFQKGQIKNPNCETIQIKSKIGEENIATNGMKMTIVDYRGCNDIDVQFEDGTLIRNKTYQNFQRGNINHPNASVRQQITDKQTNARIGKTNVNTNGLKMTIIEYRNANDIDVQFEDELVVTNRTYREFRTGVIKHPNLSKNQKVLSKQRAMRIGESNIANNNMKMTIIEYKSSNDIDVQFSDGTIVRNKTYGSFRSGGIKHPNISYHQKQIETQRKERIGETNTANNGMKMKIIAYRNSCDMDVQFEDGKVVTDKTYIVFKNGQIKHPFPYQMGNMLIEKPAYIHDNVGSFYCACTKCGHTDIMTIDEMKQHKCIEPTKGDTYAENITGTEC